MRPGITIMPEASIVSAPSGSGSDGAMAAIRSSSTSTSPCGRSPTCLSTLTTAPPLISIRAILTASTRAGLLEKGRDTR